jgi:uroporphyrinogen-III synthase
VYRTVAAEVDAARLRADLQRGALQVLSFTSPSTVRSFAACLDAAAREAAGRCIVAAIGATTAQALREAGLPPTITAERSGVAELVRALAAHVTARSGGERE